MEIRDQLNFGMFETWKISRSPLRRECVGPSFGPEAVARNHAPIFDSQRRWLVTTLTET